MKIDEKIKEKIKESLEKKSSKYFRKHIYDACLDSKYIDANGKPTIDLICLSFDDFNNIITNFFSCLSKLHSNNNCLLFNNIVENYFKYCSGSTKNSVELLIKKEKEKFSKKFEIVYNFIRDNFGAILQRENDIYICPYCERNYINVIEKGNNSFVKPDLDHYYPKSLYPFLACSIENLIPSCQVCNSRLKGGKDFYKIEHINPLKHRIFDKIRFDYNEAGIFIKNNLSLNQNEKNYLDTFKIQEIYSTHIEIKDDIKSKFDKYNNIKRKHLINCCLTLSENEILEIIFHEYEEENKKHPLRKLKKDLFEKIKNENT